MDKNIEKLHRTAIITLVLAGVCLAVFVVTSYLVTANIDASYLVSLIANNVYAFRAVMAIYFISFFGLFNFVITTSVFWLKYYQKRDAGIKTDFSSKAIIMFLIYAILSLWSFLIPARAFDGAFSNLILFFRLTGATTWASLLVCWIIYCATVRKLRKPMIRDQKREQQIAELERRVAAGEFQTYLQQFEHLTKMAAELLPSDQGKHGFSKFGGLPLAPTQFRWPRHDGQAMQFVAQFDFAEINADEQLKDFPTAGLMYVFVNEDPYERDDCKVLFYETAEKLVIKPKPNDLETVYKEIYLNTKPLKTYPDVADCYAAAKICEDNPQDGMNEVYENQWEWHNAERHLIGGWASYVQEAYFIPEQEHPEDWVLLCQIASDENCDEDGFMWGDAGTLYLYLRKKDLIQHNFNHVQLDMQCG